MYRCVSPRQPAASIRATSRNCRGSDRSMRRIAFLISLIAVLVRGCSPPRRAPSPRSSPASTWRRSGSRAPTSSRSSERRFDPAGLLRAACRAGGILTRPPARTVGVARDPAGSATLNQVYVLKSGHQLQPAAHGAAGRRRHLRARLEDRHASGSWAARARRRPGSPGRCATSPSPPSPTRLDKPDTAPRLEVLCPGGRYPIGGGMSQSPTVGADGDGIYPHSYERLGAQLGFHISVVVLDPSPTQTTSRAGHGADGLRARRDPGDARRPTRPSRSGPARRRP